MAKKSRRERRLAGQNVPKAPPPTVGAGGAGVSAPVAPGRPATSQEMPRRLGSRPQRATSAQRMQIDFEREHALVKHDLRRIGMVGGSLIAVLVVLSFFIK